MNSSVSLADSAHWVEVGRIIGPYGIKGTVLVQSYTTPEDELLSLKEFTAPALSLTLSLDTAKPHKKGLAVLFKDVVSRNAVESWRNIALYVARERLPPPGKDTYYFHDLIGLVCHTQQGDTIGQVVRVEDFGAGTLLEIERPNQKKFYLPFHHHLVTQVDLVARNLIVAHWEEYADLA